MENAYDITAHWRAFPLNTGIPEEGMPFEELFRKKGMLVNVEKAMEHLRRTAQQFGLKMGEQTRAFDSRQAQEVGLWAQSRGRGHQFHMAVFEAYFVDGENIAQKEVLLKLIKASGLDPVEGEAIIDQRTFSSAVDADWELSKTSGIAAAPTFRMGLQTLVGAKPYEVLERMVKASMGG